MTYKDLKNKVEERGLTMKFLASATKMTQVGFKISFENENLSMKNVKILSEILKISPNELIGYSPISDKTVNLTQNGGIGNQQMNNYNSLALERQLEEKDKQINVLLEIIKNK